jgi:hypothetical protein
MAKYLPFDLCHLPFELSLILHSDTGSNPSPVALRLKKTPAARHPLPKGEGWQIGTASSFNTKYYYS